MLGPVTGGASPRTKHIVGTYYIDWGIMNASYFSHRRKCAASLYSDPFPLLSLPYRDNSFGEMTGRGREINVWSCGLASRRAAPLWYHCGCYPWALDSTDHFSEVNSYGLTHYLVPVTLHDTFSAPFLCGLQPPPKSSRFWQARKLSIIATKEKKVTQPLWAQSLSLGYLRRRGTHLPYSRRRMKRPTFWHVARATSGLPGPLIFNPLDGRLGSHL